MNFIFFFSSVLINHYILFPAKEIYKELWGEICCLFLSSCGNSGSKCPVADDLQRRIISVAEKNTCTLICVSGKDLVQVLQDEKHSGNFQKTD